MCANFNSFTLPFYYCLWKYLSVAISDCSFKKLWNEYKLNLYDDKPIKLNYKKTNKQTVKIYQEVVISEGNVTHYKQW